MIVQTSTHKSRELRFTTKKECAVSFECTSGVIQTINSHVFMKKMEPDEVEMTH